MNRIVVAVTNDLTYDRRMQRICAALARAGYAVSLVGRRLPDSVALNSTSFEQVRLRCRFRKGPWFYAEYNIRLLWFLLRNPFDLAVACDLDTALAVHWAARMRRRPSVFDAHELFTEVPELAGRPLIRKVWSVIGRKTVPHFRLRYSVGPRIAEELTRRYGVPFAVIRNVPELDPSPVPALAERHRVILYQGALNAGRGLEAAIDAMASLEGYALHLVGEGDLSQALRDRVRDRGLKDRVRFLGKVPPEALPEHAMRAMVGLNLLEKQSLSYYYSLANKFFDYLHAGLPSINMDFPEYRTLVDETGVGMCLPELSSASLALTLQQLLADPSNWQAIHMRCLTARATYHWGTEEPKLLQWYRDLVAPGNVTP
ncbi:MAG: glycosyltransferase [Saprospiraceae bacterium]|nr:glycosyltransferase [Saprospiraceae bacterium]